MGSTPCPHVTPAMIAAGFTVCATCETNPQESRLAAAHAELAEAFDLAAQVATDQAKACRRKRPNPDMGKWLAAVRTVSLAEQDVDHATYDLSTARGADG